MPAWATKLIEASPFLGLCVVGGWLLIKAGWLHVRIGNRKAVPIPKPQGAQGQLSEAPRPESGRHEAVRIRDLFEEHRLEMPENWQAFVDARAEHKAANVVHERVMKEIDQNRARLARLEPEVVELKLTARENSETLVRLDENYKSLKESHGEIKGMIKEMRDEVMVALDRRHRS